MYSVFRFFRFAIAASTLIVLAVSAPCLRAGESQRAGPENVPFLQPLDSSVTAPPDDGAVLRLAQSLQREIKGGEAQVVTLNLLKDQYAEVVFAWRGTDLNVETPNSFDPQTNTTVQITGARSLPISFLADRDVEYHLTIRPVDDARIVGSYSVTLVTLRPATASDRKRVEAATLLTEAQKEKSLELAAKKLSSALELWNALGQEAEAGFALQLLGRSSLRGEPCAAASDQHSPADANYSRAIELLEKGDRKQFAYSLLDIGSDYEKFVCAARGQVYYSQALAVFRELGDKRGQASTLFMIGLAQARTGNTREALSWYEQALALQRADDNRLDEARTLNGIGGAYNILGKQEEALNFDRQAQLIFQEVGDTYRQAIMTQNIGLIFDDWGDWQTAKSNYLQSRSLFESLLSTKDLNSCKSVIVPDDAKFCNSIANTLDNLGELYNSLGDPQTALETLNEALAIRKSLAQPRGTGATLSRIAYAYLLTGNTTESLRYCDLAWAESNKAGDLRKLGSITMFRGMAYAALQNTDKAFEYYREALRLQRQTGERRGEAITLDQMGRAYALEKNWTEAFKNYDAALAIWEEVKDEEWKTRTLYNIANARQERGELVQAREQIDKAIQITEARRAKLRSMQLRTAYFANKEDLYKLAIDLEMQLAKNSATAAEVASALAMSERARARILIDTLSQVDFERRIAVELKSDPTLAALVNRKRGLETKLDLSINTQAVLLKARHTPEQIAAVAREIDTLKDSRDDVEALITTHLINPEPLTLAQLQPQIDDQTLLLEYALGEKRSYVWAVTRGSIKSVELPARNHIETLVRRMSEALNARNSGEKNETLPQRQAALLKAERDYSEASLELSKILIEPVSSILGEKRLIVVADGALQLVPFSALPRPSEEKSSPEAEKKPAVAADAKQQRLLMDDHEIVSLPSASVLALQRRAFGTRVSAPHAIAVLANPVFDQDDPRVRAAAHAGEKRETNQIGKKSSSNEKSTELAKALRDVGLEPFSPLFFSQAEANAILKVAPKGEAFAALDFKASRQTAMSRQLAQYRIIHFATHAIMDLEHPELSGILLSMVDEHGRPQNGYLRLHDIYNLNLPADLVVLSACETGIGKQVRGEGLIALTRGFMNAGAKTVVATLWKVDDAATAELMAEFYRQLFISQLKPAAALRAAQQKVSRQTRWHSPYYWAGFIIQGEWN